jgi:hypothetical protein
MPSAFQSISARLQAQCFATNAGSRFSRKRRSKSALWLAVNAAELAAKRVQLLSDAVPGLSRVAVLWNANLKGMALQFQNIEQASPQLGVILQSVRVTGSDDFDQAFAALESSHPQGLVVLYGPMRGNDLPRIVEFVTQHKLPTIFEPERGVRAGGLMEFGAKLKPMSRRAAALRRQDRQWCRPSHPPGGRADPFRACNQSASRAADRHADPELIAAAGRPRHRINSARACKGGPLQRPTGPEPRAPAGSGDS